MHGGMQKEKETARYSR